MCSEKNPGVLKMVGNFPELSRIFQNDSYNGICRGSSTGTKQKKTDKLRSLVFVFLFFWNIGGVVVITGKKYSKRFTEHVYTRCGSGRSGCSDGSVVGWYVRSGTTNIKTRKNQNFLESSGVFEMVVKFTNLKNSAHFFFFTDLRIKKNNIQKKKIIFRNKP